ncbi:MAG: anthranilate synthase component I family protein [Gemmatimonadota bacterium]
MARPFEPENEIAADLETPVSAFLKLEALEPVFLLESAAGGERLGRYSFIGLGERNRIVLERDRMLVDGVERPVSTGPMEALRIWLAEEGPDAPRIARGPAGLVGYVGYEAAGWFERLPVPQGRLFELPTAAFVVPRGILVFDHLRSTIRYHSLVDEDEARMRERVRRALSAVADRPRTGKSSPPRPHLEIDHFLDAVRAAQEHILDGDAYQIVLSIRFEGESDADPFAVYRALRILNPSPYLYFLRVAGASIVGSSPEALARLEGRRALLRPIAGTRPRGADEEEDADLARELAADAKENAEHTMLVDLARNDLGQVAATGSVEVSALMQIERYSHVMHLVSTVEGVLKTGADQFDLFRSAFPAGTVTGAPKIRAMEILHGLEGAARGPYAGAVGYFGVDGSMDQAIAIRTLVFHDGRYAFQAGAGIVADSVPDREHAEIVSKGRAMEQALELASEPI